MQPGSVHFDRAAHERNIFVLMVVCIVGCAGLAISLGGCVSASTCKAKQATALVLGYAAGKDQACEVKGEALRDLEPL